MQLKHRVLGLLCLGFIATAILMTTCFSEAVSSNVFSKRRPELLPAKEIVERHILASGGFELLSSMSTMHISWVKSDNGQQWKYERWRVRGQGFSQRSIDGQVKHTLGCWVADPNADKDSLQGVMWTQTGDRVFLQGGDRLKETLVETATIDDRTNWLEASKSVTCKGIGQVDGKDCFVIEFVSEDDEVVHRFFDTETFLLRRKTRFAEEPFSGHQSQEYADYREVGGVMMPMTLTVISQHRTDVWKVEDVEFDEEIDFEQFPLPVEAVAAIDGMIRKIGGVEHRFW